MSLGGFLGGGLTVDEFLATEFRQRCLVVRGNALDDLLPTTDILTLCEESSSDSIHVWLSKDGKIETIEVEDPKAAVLLYETAGAALYFRAPNSAEISILTAPEDIEERLVRSFLKETKLGLTGFLEAHGEVETFVAKRGHTTSYHYDFQENFTFQIRGRKKWRLKTCATHPLRARSTQFVDQPGVAEDQAKASAFCSESEGPERIIVLNPGDGLYFPAGVLHQVEALDDSLSLNVSLMGPTNADVVCAALRHLLLKRDTFRMRVSKDTDFQKLMQDAFQLQPTFLVPPALTFSGRLRDEYNVLDDPLPHSVVLPQRCIRNPLATLILEDDLRIPTTRKKRRRHQQLKRAIITVMHGGNDALEPALRTTFVMPRKVYSDDLLPLLTNGDDILTIDLPEDRSRLYAFLFFFGFLVPSSS